MTLLFTVLTGLIYPGVVTGICQLIFPHQANGSLLSGRNGQAIGSSLLGQNFTRPEYFHPRPSASGYDATNSGGSNLGPTSRKLIDRVKSDAATFRRENPDYEGPIPADIVTASGSGLDPDISPAAAEAQLPRVARARRADPAQVRELVVENTEGRTLGLLGEPRVNVLRLNLALDLKSPEAAKFK